MCVSDDRIINMANCGCWVILQKWSAQSERLSVRNLMYLNIGEKFLKTISCVSLLLSHVINLDGEAQ